MDTSKKRELLKEVVVSQFKQSKLEPFECVKLFEIIDKLSDKKVEIILKTSVKK